jgi:uncharacterized Zn-binding protein involved in type VI secretion
MPPAARVGDMHTCPMIDPGPKPHVGGPVLPPGAPTVLIGGMPAARVGDMCTCVGPPDSIAMGSPTVLIMNMMAARLGDPTVHAGVIVVGCPTVQIGIPGMGAPATVAAGPPVGPPGADPSAGTNIGEIAGMPVVRMPDGTVRVGNHIVIQGTPQFQAQVLSDLAIIANTPSSDPSRGPAGLDTLSNINNGRHDVTITETAGGNATNPANMANAQNPAVGSPSTIEYNNTPQPTAANPSINRPGDVALHHELTHADSVSAGNVNLGPAANPNNPHAEEDQAINRDNQYRDDRGIPRRADHTTL